MELVGNGGSGGEARRREAVRGLQGGSRLPRLAQKREGNRVWLTECSD